MIPKLKYKRSLPFEHSPRRICAIYSKRLRVFGFFVAANLAFILAHFLPFPIKILAVIAMATFWGFYLSKAICLLPSRVRLFKRRFKKLSTSHNKKPSSKKALTKGEKPLSITLEVIVNALTATIAVVLMLLLGFGVENESHAGSEFPVTREASMFE